MTTKISISTGNSKLGKISNVSLTPVESLLLEFTKKQTQALIDKETKRFRIRLANPQKVINKFKATPAKMWGGE